MVRSRYPISVQRAEMSSAHVLVVAADSTSALESRASSLAQELCLAYRAGGAELARQEVDQRGEGLLLVVRADRLELRAPRNVARRSLYVDFLEPRVANRIKSAGRQGQPLAKALGRMPSTPRVVDATAGLGRDAFLLAALGWNVLAIERCPVLAALLRDGLERGLADGCESARAILKRISLVATDARDLLTDMEGVGSMTQPENSPSGAVFGRPDVVYLDPMYSVRRKGALPEKERRILRQLVGDDTDAGELCAIARRVALKRVVVKRHPLAAPLMPQPDVQYRGKLVRFDVYTSPGIG